ncbi:MAG: peptidase S8, partial [Bacteroidetes bacterium]
NEKKSAGKYEVDFDVSEISPGIYFYILQGSSLELTKKMIVLW